MYKKRILHVPYSIIHILSTSIFLFKRYLHTEVCVKYSAWQSLASPFSRSPSSVWDKHWTCLGAGKFVHRTLGPTSPNDDFCKLVWWKQPAINVHRHGYGSIPINTIFSGMNIHLPAILMWTTGVQGFDTLPHDQSMDDWATEILIFHSHVLVYQKVYKYRNTSTNFGDPQLIRHWPS